MVLRTLSLLCLLGFSLALPAPLFAQDATPDDDGYPLVQEQRLLKARVLDASPSVAQQVPGTDIVTDTQTITVTLLEGPDAGTEVTFENDFTQVAAGDV